MMKTLTWELQDALRHITHDERTRLVDDLLTFRVRARRSHR